MDNYILLAIIALKGVCLFFCWKGMVVSRKQNDHAVPHQENMTTEEMAILTERMNKAMEQNRQLQKELQILKEINK